MISNLSAGDEIVTAGGMYGRITRIDDDVLTVEIAPGITVRVARGAITGVMNPEQKDNEAETPIAPDMTANLFAATRVYQALQPLLHPRARPRPRGRGP